MKVIPFLALLFFASACLAQGVPNTFTAGTAARAAEVNENFTNLDERVSANSSAIGQALGTIVLQPFSASDTGVASNLCPDNSLVVSTQCSCNNESGTRNFGVLFSCEIAGNGGVAGCFVESGTFDPTLPSPLATVTTMCVAGIQNDGTRITPVPFTDTLNSLARMSEDTTSDDSKTEFESAISKARSAIAAHHNALQAK